MKIQTEIISGLSAPILDVDVDVDVDGRVLLLYGDESSRFIRLDEREIAVETGHKPDRVRFLNDEFFIITGDWHDGYSASMYSFAGFSRWGWSIDRDVRDVSVVGRWVVIGFGDMSMKGVLLLPPLGHSMIYYDDFFGSAAVDTTDCYALCKAGQDVLYFFPYTDFQLVRWNLRTMSQQVMPTPEIVEGASAISVRDDLCYFYGPFNDEDFTPDAQRKVHEFRENNFYRWQIGSDTVELVGEFPKSTGKLRGLPGGKFLVVEADSYSIISF